MRSMLMLFCALLVFSASALPIVTNVTARQRYPWNGLVDITVTLTGTEEDCKAALFPMYATNKATGAELPIRSVTSAGAATGAGNTWTRRFVWNATADVGRAKFGEVALTVGTPFFVGVQLWENGPYWAECNVGATKPEESGYYFWWGDTVGYKRNTYDSGWISSKDSTTFSFLSVNCPTQGKSISQLRSAGYIDSTGNLAAKYDAATAYLGAPWRLPTDAEVSALISNCTTTWTTRNGVCGRLITGKGAYASKSIFIPAAGHGANNFHIGLGSSGAYWSSTPDSDDSDNAYHLISNSDAFLRTRYSLYRDYGLSVRPVRGFVD